MLIIYGADLSSYANKVRFTANYLNIPYTYKKVSLRDREHKMPEYIRLHPASKIPVIDDEGFVLFESNAIIKYLADKHNSGLYPKDLKKRALIDQWIDFATLHVGSAVDRVAFNRVFAPRIKAPVDERSVKTGMSFLARFLPVVEGQLAKQAFLVFEIMSLADMTLLAALEACEAASIDLTKYEKLTAYLNALRQKDFYTKCHTSYAERLKEVFGP